MSGAKKIALVEMGGSHDECLYAQLRYLKADAHEVTLICNSSLKSNVEYFDGLDKVHYIELRSGLKQWIDLRIIRKILKNGRFDRIVFNTAQGNVLKNFFLLPKLKNVQLYGVIHNLRKLQGSHSQKLITKNLDGYFVLNDYLIDKVDPELRKSVNLNPLYTVFYPNYPSKELKKDPNQIWVCIPGQVERSRRDYDALFESIEKIGLSNHIKLLFLGRCEHADGDGSYVKKRIAALEIEENVILWDNFIETDEFYGVLNASDYILPLIHPQHDSYSLYEYQISGSFNLAFGFKKPLLMEESFGNYEDFNTTSVFYSISSLMEVINSLKSSDQHEFYSDEKWDFDGLKHSYLKALQL
ncbi:MAG: hypothetical protein AB8B56_07230 [Crocinitomicaceae bacterium]